MQIMAVLDRLNESIDILVLSKAHKVSKNRHDDCMKALILTCFFLRILNLPYADLYKKPRYVIQ